MLDDGIAIWAFFWALEKECYQVLGFLGDIVISLVQRRPVVLALSRFSVDFFLGGGLERWTACEHGKSE